jgi:ribosomal protein L14E/L6E/L27E
MPLIEVGRVCIKKFGRDAGSRAAIVAIEKDGTVRIVSEMRQKERKCNPSHLEYLNEVVDPKNREQLAKAVGIKEKPPSHAAKQQAKKTGK